MRMLSVIGMFVAGLQGGIIESSFLSSALGKEMPYCLWLPEGDPPQGGRWPLLVMLHGRGRHHKSLLEQEGVMATLEGRRLCVAFPKGDDGWWIDSPALQTSRYGSMLKEFVHHVE